jgi:hypothetical protein
MLETRIIEPVEESEWIIPMVVQDKKSGEIIIFVDLRKLNDACLHDPFPDGNIAVDVNIQCDYLLLIMNYHR